MKTTAWCSCVILLMALAAGPASGQDAAPDPETFRLAYEVQGDGEPILFIHGSLMEDALLTIMQESTLRGYQRVHYDRAGYGESPARGEPFSFERGAADALEVIRQLDLESAHLVGYSLGGVIAVQLARSNPEVVKSLVLLEPPIGPRGRDPAPTRELPRRSARLVPGA